MALPDRDRKILWARAHDTCAKCRTRLVAEASATDREAVVGQEAHIVSGAPGGPRAGDRLPASGVDSYDNMILLCPTCHRVVDAQPATWPTPKLRQVKAEHEAWADALVRGAGPVRLVAHPDDPDLPGGNLLAMMLTGADLWQVLTGSHLYYLSGLEDDQGHPQDLVDHVDAFLQRAQDWAEVTSVVEQTRSGLRQAQRALAADLRVLDERGLVVFGGRRRRLLTGGVGPPSQWTEAHLVVLVRDDPGITATPLTPASPAAATASAGDAPGGRARGAASPPG